MRHAHFIMAETLGQIGNHIHLRVGRIARTPPIGFSEILIMA